MGLFNSSQIEAINAVAEKSKEALKPAVSTNSRSINADIAEMSDKVKQYFRDSNAILIQDVQSLHSYIDRIIEFGYAGIDTETTGLDRIHDTIVGTSLYVPGQPECYIPINHIIPIFDERYKGQLSYEEVGNEYKRLADNKVKLIFANADFDLAMIYKDLKVDLLDVCYFDVILAWRCLRENEKDNSLKGLYTKYVLRGKGDPMKFRDFFTPQLFPYCKPEVAKLYAGNDAKITYELFRYELPYITKENEKCKKHHLEAIADLVWNIEMPLIRVCQNMHRRGVYLDKEVASRNLIKYSKLLEDEKATLSNLVSESLSGCDYSTAAKSPFRSGSDFNPNSTVHVQYLLRNVLKCDIGKSADKHVLEELNLPVTKQIIKVRNVTKLMSTYVEKLPKATTPDSKIHAIFNSIGADTGRFSSASPNMQNIPSHAGDIRHMFRATPSSSSLLDCEYDEKSDTIEIDISMLNKVMVKDKGDVTVADLAVGDEVKLIEDHNKEVYRRVQKISVTNTDSSLCHVVF